MGSHVVRWEHRAADLWGCRDGGAVGILGAAGGGRGVGSAWGAVMGRGGWLGVA